MPKLQFFINCQVEYGNALYIVGNSEELGQWDNAKAIRLEYTEGDNWVGSVEVNIGQIEYKQFISNYNHVDQLTRVSQVIRKIVYQFEDHNTKVINIMSFNIRFANVNDGVNIWDNRKSMVVKVIENQYDFVGLQEVLRNQYEYLEAQLPHFSIYGRGRDNHYLSGEAAPILYNHNKWEIMNGGTFWLSDTPNASGSKSYGNVLPRICTWLTFKNKLTHEITHVYNCHLDHIHQESQHKSAYQIKEHMAQNIKGRIILMGDLNQNTVSQTYKILREQLIFLQDTFKISQTTFHNWSGLDIGICIDHFLISKDYDVISAEVIKYNENSKYPSDHFPIAASII